MHSDIADVKTIDDASASTQPVTTEERVIALVEERLDISRRVVDTGRTLRVRKVVDEEVADVDETVVDEFVDVERIAVGRVVDAPVATRHEGDVMIVPVLEERLVVSRQLVLTEEIHIRRRRQQRQVRDSVRLRRERVVIERFDPVLQVWTAVDDSQAEAVASGPDPPVV